MYKYRSVPVDRAYHLINHGPVVLVSSRSGRGQFDLAPIAWCCPVGMEPCQVLLALAPGHRTTRNIRQTRKFIVCVPGRDQVKWVRQTGSLSGAKADKFEKFNIPSFLGKKVECRVPQGSLAYLECSLLRTIPLEEVTLVVGKCVYAAARAGVYKGRILVEKPANKTLHHLGGDVFALPGEKLL